MDTKALGNGLGNMAYLTRERVQRLVHDMESTERLFRHDKLFGGRYLSKITSLVYGHRV